MSIELVLPFLPNSKNFTSCPSLCQYTTQKTSIFSGSWALNISKKTNKQKLTLVKIEHGCWSQVLSGAVQRDNYFSSTFKQLSVLPPRLEIVEIKTLIQCKAASVEYLARIKVITVGMICKTNLLA